MLWLPNLVNASYATIFALATDYRPVVANILNHGVLDLDSKLDLLHLAQTTHLLIHAHYKSCAPSFKLPHLHGGNW